MNILFVSIAFPPKNDPESFQAARYFKYLSRIPGVNIDVVTSKNPTLWMPIDETLFKYTKGIRQLLEIPIFEPRFLSIFLFKFFKNLVFFPDLRLTFHLQSRRVFRLLKHKPDVIYSRSFPLSSTILAYKLQKKYHVPWVMHLSDPWIDQNIIKFEGLSRKYNLRMQGICFDNATIITLASKRMLEMYKIKYPKFSNKFFLSPNVYDPSDFVNLLNKVVKREKVKYVYTGSIAGIRSIKPIISAIKWIKENEPDYLNKFEVIIAGALDSANIELVKSMSQFITYLGKVSLIKSQELQHEADVLLAIDFPLPKEESVFLLSKILDYFLTRNPIIAITTPGSMTDEIVSNGFGNCIDYSNTEGLGKLIVKQIIDYNNGVSLKLSNNQSVEFFSAELQARNLYELIQGIVI